MVVNKSNIDNKNITVFSIRLASYLMFKGFALICVTNNTKKNDGTKVFFFKGSDEVREAIKFYSERKTDISNGINLKHLEPL